ncbi:cupin domain-containing protein [Streptomyces lonarensis]|uniref:Cupin domain-containing protein n=2 Tax=Streptomyces lonarensis TaxID=700599 RepID=A0A7X6CYC0_9ACTN|nr:cupin domain-containing protein [Streptomyces lonarensis]
MITKFPIEESSATREFGMACQRLIPWRGDTPEPPVGAMACFLPAGSASDPDCHAQDEVMIVLSGGGTIELDGEKAEFTANEVLVLPRGKEHVVHASRNVPCTWVSVYWPLHEHQASGTAEVDA